MDNFSFDITTDGGLGTCLALAFSHHGRATHWQEQTGSIRTRLVLAWTDPGEGWHPFPTPLTADRAEGVVQDWLRKQNYGTEPDHDGDNAKGFRVYNDAWGHVDGKWQAFVAIEPAWAMYGK